MSIPKYMFYEYSYMYVQFMSKHFLGRGRHKTVNQSVQSSGALIIIDLKNNYLLKNLLTG